MGLLIGWPLTISLIWTIPTSHSSDYYFCLTDTKHIAIKTIKTCARTTPETIENETLDLDLQEASLPNEPHQLSQRELNDLLRDLY